MAIKKVAITSMLLVICLLSAAFANEQETIVIETEGAGKSSAEAFADARLKAIQWAVGFVTEGRTEVINDRAKESVVQLSRAFIEKHDVLNERDEKGKFYVKAKFWISQKSLLTSLLRDDSKKSDFDGAGLFSKAISREQKIKDAAEILSEIFRSLKIENYVVCEATAENFNAAQGVLSLKVNFLFDRKRYFLDLVPQIVSVLDYVGESKQSNIPLIFTMKAGNPITVTPPPSPKYLQEYLSIMELKNGNRYIEIQNTANFANIYILTKNYYFNSYSVPDEVFQTLVKNLFYTDKQGRLNGKSFQNTVLKVRFQDKNNINIHEYLQAINLDSIAFFTNAKDTTANKISGEKHAIFILPFMGTAKTQDYILIDRETADLQIKINYRTVNAINKTSCEISGIRKVTNF